MAETGNARNVEHLMPRVSSGRSTVRYQTQDEGSGVCLHFFLLGNHGCRRKECKSDPVGWWEPETRGEVYWPRQLHDLRKEMDFRTEQQVHSPILRHNYVAWFIIRTTAKARRRCQSALRNHNWYETKHKTQHPSHRAPCEWNSINAPAELRLCSESVTI